MVESVIEINEKRRIRLEHAGNGRDGRARIRHVSQHAERVGEVEAARREGQRVHGQPVEHRVATVALAGELGARHVQCFARID
jgi:hypothetical protein